MGITETEMVQAAKDAIERQHDMDQASSRAKGDALVERDRFVSENPERLAVRLNLIQRSDPNAFERLIGQRDIVSVNFFKRGLLTAKAVCRVKTLGINGGPPSYATGFLIGPELLVTNNHVLPDPDTASRSLAEFEYELDVNFVEQRGRIYPFAPLRAFYTSRELDFTVVAISPVAHDGTPITDFGVVPLIAESGKGLVGEHVSVIQHPAGGTKQVVVRENRIIDLDRAKFPGLNPGFMHYTADTEPGSSGSPVFNDQWNLVAIHHLAVADRDDDGKPLNRWGKRWTSAEGDDAIRWIANEGLRISALWEDLHAAASFNPDAARILMLLNSQPQTRPSPRPRRSDPTPPKWQTLPDAGEAEAFEASRFSEPAFKASTGYDPKFLGPGLDVPLPKASRGIPLAKNTVASGTVFDYTHFSLAMHAKRRLALWTAVNIDGAKIKIPTKGPGWRRDKRLPASQQTLAEVYGKVAGKGLQIDRGHLVRRLDPVWGDQEVADRAAADTFHYTNAAPQEHDYNSETWGNLEDFVLARAAEREHKVTVFTGPVLRPDDEFYGADLKGGPWQIPWSFWKIAIFRRPDNSVSVTGFIVEQTSTIASLFEAARFQPYTIEGARVFQRRITLIEQLTGLDFGKLRTMDRMRDVEATTPASARPIKGASDIAF